MTQTLAMFPLELVVFPGEKLALHIFEDRYQQLIADCEKDSITFGIPAYINKSMTHGTEVRLDRVVKRYPSGASDVVCKGLKVFRIGTFYNTMINKQYAGASIGYIDSVNDGTPEQQTQFVSLTKELYDALDVPLPAIDPLFINTFSFAHKIGMALEQEHRLIQMPSQADRFTYLIDHLCATIPIIKQMNRTRELIKMNGHFKNFDPLDFSEYYIKGE